VAHVGPLVAVGLISGSFRGPPRFHPSPRRRAIAAGIAIVLAAAVGLAATIGRGSPTSRGASNEVRILTGAPNTLDPAAQGDVGSAAISAQLFESLTAVDPSLALQPALAASWDVLDDGRRIVFHLRAGLTFSDGSPLSGEDVVGSWLRLIDHRAPSPLASLMLDVKGAGDYLAGTADAADVGLKANGNDVEVDLARPAADFPTIVAGPSFGVVPKSVRDGTGPISPDRFVGSGGYVLTAANDSELTLTASDRYWAGRPPIRILHLLADTEGRSSVAAFEDDDLDYTGIADFDASWIRYDKDLGPQLRRVPSLSLEYIGFDTTRPPFDDVRVRRAFGEAVDWRRIVELGNSGSSKPATSMVPPGIPGRSDTDFLPAHDPDAARALLAEAGYPGGRGFPKITFVDPSGAYTGAIVAELERELGVKVAPESMDFTPYFSRLAAEPPQMWTLDWVADYPGQNDFLGVLLGTGRSTNYGRSSSDEFDAAITDAGETTDPRAASAAFERALGVVQRDVPVIPVSYADGWALSRKGLLGAGQNGLGILRMAGLAWEDK
jgi:oligopeptide transport system substrate-binding protein